MLASQLRPEEFKGYPPQARELAVSHIELLRQMPTLFVAVLLREVVDYDWKFPAEREQLDRQLGYLGSLSPGQRQALFAKFAEIDLPAKLEHINWAKEPKLFSERLTANLWSTHQIDAFRVAATEYEAALSRAIPAEPARIPRLGIVVIGHGVAENDFPLFRKLRPHGALFTNVNPDGGMETLIGAVSARAKAHPEPYRHWYIGGSTTENAGEGVTTISYDALQPVRTALLRKMQEYIQGGGAGPEPLEVAMARLSPEELGMRPTAGSEVLDHFQVTLLTEGAGTQIFSTTFVQWAAREALQHAQPDTLLARFTPRQRQRPMNELIEAHSSAIELDAEGSLVDADMGAYYIWIDQQRLANADRASFLVWFEGHNQALGIGPTLPRGTSSNSRANLSELLQWVS